MSDAIPNAHRKPTSRREKAPSPRPLPASAEALASAVRDAETSKAAKAAPPAPRPVDAAPAGVPDVKPVVAAVEPAPVMPAPVRPEPAPRSQIAEAVREYGPLAAALTMALGLGWVTGLATAIHGLPHEAPPAAPAALVMDFGLSAPLAIRGPQGETTRLAGDVGALARAVVDLRAEAERARADGAARLARLEVAEGQSEARLAALAERIGGIKDGEAQLAAILERLERMEEAAITRAAAVQPASPAIVAAAPVLPAPAPAASMPEPVTTASLPEARAPERPGIERVPAAAVEKAPERTEVVSGWFLRGVHRGVALVEGRRGLVEVRAGEVIPGLGRVEAIERRGRDWVVVTARGIVATESW